MNRPELYQKTVDVLVAAYFNDTLEHGNYCACAVGNIIIANAGLKIQRSENRASQINWLPGQLGLGNEWYESVRFKMNNAIADAQILATGYSIMEIIKIESAFESARDDNSIDEAMLNGLMAVIDILDQIHENTDAVVTATIKQRFVKA